MNQYVFRLIFSNHEREVLKLNLTDKLQEGEQLFQVSYSMLVLEADWKAKLPATLRKEM